MTDDELRKAWAHLTTAQIKAMPPERGEGAQRVNAARKRILALREKDQASGK